MVIYSARYPVVKWHVIFISAVYLFVLVLIIAEIGGALDRLREVFGLF